MVDDMPFLIIFVALYAVFAAARAKYAPLIPSIDGA